MGLGVSGYVFFAKADEFPGVKVGSMADWIAPFVLGALAALHDYSAAPGAGAPDEPPPPTR